MIQIKSEAKCCGCGTCANACPKQCISMVESAEGFRFPNVDNSKCVDCGLCEKVCPYLNLNIKGDTLKSPNAYFIRSKDETVLKTSASGGLFYEIAKKVILKGGVVFGAVWGEKVDEVYHRSVNTLEDLRQLQGSKYLQSDVRHCYSEAKALLQKGVLVLFSGTPCQIAGLLTYLRKDYDNLVTCDLICHGVPSPLVFNKYIQEVEKKEGKKVVRYFRDKKNGWKPAMWTVKFEDGTCVPKILNSPFSILFSQKNVQQRNSCYDCRFTRSPRIADISLGDYFVERDALDMKGNPVSATDNKGMSLITVNTRQGELWFNEIKDCTEATQLQVQTLTSWHLFAGPNGSSSDRSLLFKMLKKGYTVSEAYDILYGKNCRWKRLWFKLTSKLAKK